MCRLDQKKYAISVNHSWIDGLPDASYDSSDKGWMTIKLFKLWLVDHFLKHAVTENSGFSAAQDKLYQRRVEEGCDLFIDSDYVRWLCLYHPELCDQSQQLIISHT